VPVQVRPARGGPDYQAASGLIMAYAQEFADDLGRQDFDEEVLWLAEHYGPPEGRLLLADDGAIVGCVAFERLDASTCRMKRMVVAPSARGRGIGDLLCRAIVAEARAAGYRRIVLDTTPRMEAARALYAKHGFEAVAAPDWASLCPTPVFMQLRLAP
jgi:GNAT superfamily N-acetyltransferase